jgi:hypothetical protein
MIAHRYESGKETLHQQYPKKITRGVSLTKSKKRKLNSRKQKVMELLVGKK